MNNSRRRRPPASATIEIDMVELKDRNDKPFYVSKDPELDLTINLMDWVMKVFPNKREDGKSFPKIFLTPRKLNDDGEPINPVPHTVPRNNE